VQHFIRHLSPTGIAGFVLANGSLSSNTSNEGEIRKNIIEADIIDCIVALPSQLFYNTMISACLWFVSRDKENHRFRDRRGQVLFIDARKLGILVDRRHKELTDQDINKISNTYHVWRGELKDKKYEDTLGFCKSVSLGELRDHSWILTPGRFVGAAEEEEDKEVFEEKMKRLTAELAEQLEEGSKLEEAIKRNLARIGYGI
jgi:type I restriction enzyme M protein